MSTGFGAKKQTKEQYMKNFFKTSKALLNGFSTPEEAKQNQSREWFNKYVRYGNKCSTKELLNPKREKLRLDYNFKLPGDNLTNVVFAGFNGLRRVIVFEREDRSYDFDISVLVGTRYRFHPDLIKHAICASRGADIYDEWKRLSKADIDSLAELIQLISSKLKSVAWSYTCSISSAKLCQEAGVSTHRCAAFLFPACYQ
jgi:hypothetical protein